MRTSLKGVNTFFRETVDKMPCPTVYIPELAEKKNSCHKHKETSNAEGEMQ